MTEKREEKKQYKAIILIHLCICKIVFPQWSKYAFSLAFFLLGFGQQTGQSHFQFSVLVRFNGMQCKLKYNPNSASKQVILTNESTSDANK